MIDEIKKIDLNETDLNENGSVDTANSSIATSKRGLKMKFSKKKLAGGFSIVLALVIVLGLVGFFGVFLPVQGVMSSVNALKASVKESYDAAKNQNITLTQEKLKVTRNNLSNTEKKMKVLAWTGILPFFGNYYKDGQSMVKAGYYGLDIAEIMVESVAPYADLLGLKGQGSFVGGSAEERVQKAVETLDKVTPNLGKVAEKMALLRKEIDKVDTSRYPENFRGMPLRSQLVMAKNLVDQADLALTDARPLFEVLPSLLGQPTEKKYLLLFQNDKELRSTGGFLTAYAILRLEKGKIIVEGSDDIYKLDDQKTKKVAAPAPILKYLPLVPYWNLRDANISPDFYVSMKNFEEIYSSIPKRTEFTGIVAIDTQFLVKVMDILGPIPVYGTEFTTKIVPECNCPEVIWELEQYADKPVGYARGSRKDIIGALMKSIMHKALSSSPKLYWGPLFQSGITALNEKHVLVYLKDEKAQKSIQALNYGGRIREYAGDYLHVNDTNFAGAKSNMYVQEFVEQKIEVANDGTVTKTVKIDYKNPQPPSDCNLERGNLCLNGILRNWVRVYVPKGSKLIENRGSEVKMTTTEDLGKTVFEGFLTVRPLGSARIELKYQLPNKVEKNNYKLLVQKQPGTEGHQYTVIVNANKKEEFKLITDKELTLDY